MKSNLFIVKQLEKGYSIARKFFTAKGEGRSNADCIATDDNKVMRKIGSKDVPVFRLFDYTRKRSSALLKFRRE